MRLEVENKPVVENATSNHIRKALLSLRSYGPSSFATLTDEQGNYLQIAGGSTTCMLEHRNAITGKHYRGYQDIRSNIFPDGTLLVFGGGEIPMQANEWFSASTLIDAFVAFLHKEELPNLIKWRDITDMLK